MADGRTGTLNRYGMSPHVLMITKIGENVEHVKVGGESIRLFDYVCKLCGENMRTHPAKECRKKPTFEDEHPCRCREKCVCYKKCEECEKWFLEKDIYSWWGNYRCRPCDKEYWRTNGSP